MSLENDETIEKPEIIIESEQPKKERKPYTKKNDFSTKKSGAIKQSILDFSAAIAESFNEARFNITENEAVNLENSILRVNAAFDIEVNNKLASIISLSVSIFTVVFKRKSAIKDIIKKAKESK